MLIIKTTVPVELLKNLQQQSCAPYFQGNNNIPVWSIVVTGVGYLFKIVDSCENVNDSSTSDEWLTEWIENHEFCKVIDEHYIIENQPE